MKKREKFLLAFLISFVIVMVTYIIYTTRRAHNSVNDAEYEIEHGYNNYINYYTIWYNQEGEKLFEYYEERANEFIKSSINEKILIIAEEMYYDKINNYGDMTNYLLATEIITVFKFTILGTIIIYSIITIELKDKKQYFVDNIKLLLIIFIFFILILAISYLQKYIIGYYDLFTIKMTSSEKIEYILNDIFSIIISSLLTLSIVFIPNLITNLIKNKKYKNQNNK